MEDTEKLGKLSKLKKIEFELNEGKTVTQVYVSTNMN